MHYSPFLLQTYEVERGGHQLELPKSMACTQGEAVSLALGAVAAFAHKLNTEHTNRSQLG